MQPVGAPVGGADGERVGIAVGEAAGATVVGWAVGCIVGDVGAATVVEIEEADDGVSVVSAAATTAKYTNAMSDEFPYQKE